MGFGRCLAASLLLMSLACNWTPEKIKDTGRTTQTVGEFIRDTGKAIPGPVGFGAELIGGLLATVGAGITSVGVLKAKRAEQEKQIALDEKKAATAALDATAAAIEKKGSEELKHQVTKEARKRKVSGYVEAFVAKKSDDFT